MSTMTVFAQLAVLEDLCADAGVQQDLEAMRLVEAARAGDRAAWSALVACGLVEEAPVSRPVSFVVVVSGLGHEAATEEDLHLLQQAYDDLEDDTSWVDEVSGETVTPCVVVRKPRLGEAEGTYQVTWGGGLQILGYTIPVPEALRLLGEQAWSRAFA